MTKKVQDQSWTPIFAKVDKIKKAQSIMLDLFPQRYLAWNWSYVRAQCGTIEFRRPPGIKEPADAKHWISVVLGFTAHALWREDWGRVAKTKTHPEVHHLAACLANGLRLLDRTSHGALNQISADKRDAWYPNDAEAEMIRRKILYKKSVFAEKAASRPNTPN